ncbi:MAG: DUF4369 domain-containing protein [Bacteroidales bacterium]|nr:DUF4369 domain-containing protein [Bacteroidales bacterium]
MRTLLLLQVIFLFLSCSDRVCYTIGGTIEGASEGDSVILFYSSNGDRQSIAGTTTIRNGEFTFKGETDACGIYYIGYEKCDTPLYALFFLEEGDIRANITRERSLFYGTPNNERNRICEDTLAHYLQVLSAIENRFYTDSLSVEEMTTLGIKGYETQKALVEYIHKSVEDNCDNLFGLFMLVVYNDFFEPQEFSRLLKMVPADLINRSNNSLYDIAVEIELQNNINNIQIF